MPKHCSVLLYVHRNRKAYYDGKPRTATSTFTQLLNSELPALVVFAFCVFGRGWVGCTVNMLDTRAAGMPVLVGWNRREEGWAMSKDH